MIELTPLLSSLMLNTVNQLVQTAIAEEIDNPYLKATLTALSETFSQGIMDGMSPEQMEEKARNQLAETAGVAVSSLPREALIPTMAAGM